LITFEGGTLRGHGTLGNLIEVDGTQCSISVAASQALTLNGAISGSYSSTITRGGSAALYLGGDNDGFYGTFSQSSGYTFLTANSAGSEHATWNINGGYLESKVSGDIKLGALSGYGYLMDEDPLGGPVTFVIGGSNQSSEFDGTILDGTGPVSLTKVGAGRLTLGSWSISYSGVTTIQGGTLEVTYATTTMSLFTSGVNDTGGFLVLDYGYEGGPTQAEMDAEVLSLLTAAYNNGFLSGQICDTSATTSIGLGWVDSPTINGNVYTYQIWIMPALYGDANLDGTVNASDLAILGLHWKLSQQVWADADFNYDGTVNASDLAALGLNWKHTGPLDINNAP
jgi:autotransporter-associated beta strand protein